MTNYNKWDTLCAELHSDTESEENFHLREYTTASARFVRIPAGDVEVGDKEKLCCWLQDFPEFADVAADARPGAAEHQLIKELGWLALGSGPVVGYKRGGADADHWRLYFDDSFLSSQKVANVAARPLLGTEAKGDFIVHCLRNGQSRPVSRKEIADLIVGRGNGDDAGRISAEQKDHEESLAKMKKQGLVTMQM